MFKIRKKNEIVNNIKHANGADDNYMNWNNFLEGEESGYDQEKAIKLELFENENHEDFFKDHQKM